MIDAAWARLLSLAVHEFRTPVTVVGGYVRLLLSERAGPLAPGQRRILEEIQKSCGRLSTLLAELGDLASLETGKAVLQRGRVELGRLVDEVVASAPAAANQPPLRLVGATPELVLDGDQSRLRGALAALVQAIRREVGDAETEVIVDRTLRERGAERAAWIAIGPAAAVERLRGARAEELAPFDEFRGGCGLSLPLARRVVELHGGRLLAPPGEQQRAAVAVELPLG